MDLHEGNALRKRLQLLARETVDLENFIDPALQLVCEFAHARSVDLQVKDLKQKLQLIHARLTRKGKGWTLEVDDTDLYAKPSSIKRSYPKFLLHSKFCFFLDLSPRWSGTLVIEYPGLRILSSGQYQNLCTIFADLGDSLYIVLMDQKMRALEIQEKENEQINQELRQNITDLSKEAYCVSSVVTGLTQSFNAVKIFTRILGSTLPILKAKLGDVYFPESSQCISFQSVGSQYFYSDYEHVFSDQQSGGPCLRHYFENKFSLLDKNLTGVSINFLPVNHDSFSVSMKKRFKSLGVLSVLEFFLCSGKEIFGLGLIGFAQKHVEPHKSRLFKITLNMTHLFMENISLMRDLDLQVKQKSKEILGMEKDQRFFFDHGARPLALSKKSQPVPPDQILEEIDRSRKAVFLGELASGVAHQIRNPLNNLVAVLHLLKNKDTEEDNGQLIDQVTERVETIHQMINKFIHYTQIPELSLTMESVNDVLKNTLHAFKSWIDLARIELTTSFDPELFMTRLDLYLMDQVYHNIIKNALEAMYSDGKLHITTRKLGVKHGPAPHLEFAEISFQDSGPGIPKEDIHKVLNPFFSRKKDGIGLGLAIVDHVVGLHGGGVRITNEPGTGTNVTIYLPIR